jgi:hypothetical protein
VDDDDEKNDADNNDDDDDEDGVVVDDDDEDDDGNGNDDNNDDDDDNDTTNDNDDDDNAKSEGNKQTTFSAPNCLQVFFCSLQFINDLAIFFPTFILDFVFIFPRSIWQSSAFARSPTARKQAKLQQNCRSSNLTKKLLITNASCVFVFAHRYLAEKGRPKGAVLGEFLYSFFRAN